MLAAGRRAREEADLWPGRSREPDCQKVTTAVSSPRACFPLLLVALACLAAPPALAAGELPTATATAAASGAPTGPLPELPRLAPITYPEADAASLKELDRILEALTGEDDRSRSNARGMIADTQASLVPAIRQRIQDVRGTLDRETAPRVLEDARKAGREALKKKGKGDGDAEPKKKSKKADKSADKAGSDKKVQDEADDGDWLDFVLAKPKPKSDSWRDLVKLLAMERMLVAIGTTPAIREMIQLHAYFGDLLRIDLQRQVGKLKDKAVPALIEARQHDAKIVQKWASRQLDILGRAIPGEAVSTNDTAVLADVLRAYGRTRDVDAARVILSFANSDRIQLREAAREAIAAIGEPGVWQLRDVYLNLTGNKPPRDWSWDRIAREIFAAYDRARLAEVYKLMDDGVAAAQAGKLAEAVEAFDKVLARAPLFERRKEMVKTYVARSKELPREQREEALAMLRKALRLDPKSPDAKKLEAEIAYLEGVVLMDRGTPDKLLLKKAIELDPSHERARAALVSLEDQVAPQKDSTKRYFAAAGLGLAALLAMILIYRRKPKVKAPPPPPEPAAT
jgi:tetratricopeptide (TPR) repeat protein